MQTVTWHYVLSVQQSLIVVSTSDRAVAERVAQDYANQTAMVVIIAEGPPPDGGPLPGQTTLPLGVFNRNQM
jgi:hypothetical protein